MKSVLFPLLLVLAALAGCGDKDKKSADESAAAGEAKAAGESGQAAAAGEAAEAKAGAAEMKTATLAEGVAAGEPAAGGMPAGWVRFELAEDNFAVALPRQPGPPESFDVPTELGVGSGKVYMVQAAPYYYALGVTTMPKAILDDPEPLAPDVVAASFDGGVSQMLATVNGTKTSERDIEVRGLPAREVTYTVSVEGQRVEGLARMIADPRTKKIYQVQILSDRPVAEASKPFFESFEILSQK